ncbi:MAG: glycosyltransferase family 2 protein [Betaproteobacteria bacterium]|nr:glycosyltransferase family 2 protein [Betaproteobacteria bacterium]
MGLRICGLTIVRDEEDIVEASIRHNLGALDALTVVDHGSDDGTSAIVEALRAEGLPIDLVHEEAIEYRQSDIMTAHARRILAGGADLCCPLDADEFLRVPSRADFERAAERAGATRCAPGRAAAHLLPRVRPRRHRGPLASRTAPGGRAP